MPLDALKSEASSVADGRLIKFVLTAAGGRNRPYGHTGAGIDAVYSTLAGDFDDIRRRRTVECTRPPAGAQHYHASFKLRPTRLEF